MGEKIPPHGSAVPLRSASRPSNLLWRRWSHVLVQVCFSPWDLRRITDAYALQWRRSHLFFRTCAKNSLHLRQKLFTPAPKTLYTCANYLLHLHQELPIPAPSYSLVHLFGVISLQISRLLVERCTSRCTCREGVRCVSMSWGARGARGWGITKQETGRVSCGLIGERCCWEYIYKLRTA